MDIEKLCMSRFPKDCPGCWEILNDTSGTRNIEIIGQHFSEIGVSPCKRQISIRTQQSNQNLRGSPCANYLDLPYWPYLWPSQAARTRSLSSMPCRHRRRHSLRSLSADSTTASMPLAATWRRVLLRTPTGIRVSAIHPFLRRHLKITGTVSAKGISAHSTKCRLRRGFDVPTCGGLGRPGSPHYFEVSFSA